MWIKKIIYFFIISILLTSCYTCWVYKTIPKQVSRNIKKCYDSIPTGLDSIIPINGYYTMKNYYKSWNIELKKSETDTLEIEFMFYKNGFFSWRDFRWGNYFLNGDTIIAYYFTPPCGQTWGGSEHWFLINQDSTLSYIYHSSLNEIKGELETNVEKERVEGLKKYTKAKFNYVDSIPDIRNVWLFRTKWFRCKIK